MIYRNSFSDKLMINFLLSWLPTWTFPIVSSQVGWLGRCVIIIQNYKFSSPLHIRLYPIVLLSPLSYVQSMTGPHPPRLCGAKIRWKKFSHRKNKQRQACMQIGDNLVMFLAEGMWGRGNGCRGGGGVRRLGT